MASRRYLVSLLLFLFLAGCTADVPQNLPPTVTLSVGAELDVTIGDTVRIQVNAIDPEGGATKFGWEYRPNDRTWSLGTAVFLQYASQAVFEWSPIASDRTTLEDPLRLIFIVEDANGKRTEKVVALTIVPGNGQPRFLNNASELYDPRTGKPLEIRVRVRDDDSSSVAVTMPQGSAPIGSSFDQFESLEGVFKWQPSLEQLEKRVHSVVFVADDGQNDPVEFPVTIVLRVRGEIEIEEGQAGDSCPGEAVIVHAPLGPQTGLDDYAFQATMTAAGLQRYDSMYLYWTYGDAYNGDLAMSMRDEDRFQAIEMEREGDQFYASINNQASIIGANQVLRIYYTICAVDEDSGDGTSVVCAPSLGDLDLYYGFLAYTPDAGGGCIDDGVDLQSLGNDTMETASNPSTERWDGFQVCGDDADVFSLRVKPGESYVLGLTYPRGQNLSVDAYDRDRNALPLSFSDCTGVVTLERSVAEGASAETIFLEVRGDNIAYQIKAFKKGGSMSSCVDDLQEPNDDAFDATRASDGFSLAAEICDEQDFDVYGIELGGGDKLSVTTTFSNNQGNLDMTLFSPEQFQDISGSGTGVAFTFSFDDTETLNFDVVEAGTYFLLVFSNDSPNRYEISFDVEQAPPCSDTDSYSGQGAGNHSQESAAPIALYSEDELTICPGLSDWYQRTIFPGSPVLGELNVLGDGELSAFSLEVYDLQGQKIQDATRSSTGLDVDISNDTSTPAQYYLRVFSSAAARYELYLVN
jgi:hypothetical protein